MVLPRHLLKNGGHARGVFQRRKNTQIPLISLALRPQTIRHPDKCSKLENDATCRLAAIAVRSRVAAMISDLCHLVLSEFIGRLSRLDTGPEQRADQEEEKDAHYYPLELSKALSSLLRRSDSALRQFG
jgi:hypothetical protein